MIAMLNFRINAIAIFDARSYASAVYAMALCPSVTSRSSDETADELSWLLAWKLSSATIHYVVYGNYDNSRNKDTSLGILSLTVDLNLATESRWCQQNSSTVELLGHTYDGRRVVAERT